MFNYSIDGLKSTAKMALKVIHIEREALNITSELIKRNRVVIRRGPSRSQNNPSTSRNFHLSLEYLEPHF